MENVEKLTAKVSSWNRKYDLGKVPARNTTIRLDEKDINALRGVGAFAGVNLAECIGLLVADFLKTHEKKSPHNVETKNPESQHGTSTLDMQPEQTI